VSHYTSQFQTAQVRFTGTSSWCSDRGTSQRLASLRSSSTRIWTRGLTRMTWGAWQVLYRSMRSCYRTTLDWIERQRQLPFQVHQKTEVVARVTAAPVMEMVVVQEGAILIRTVIVVVRLIQMVIPVVRLIQMGMPVVRLIQMVIVETHKTLMALQAVKARILARRLHSQRLSTPELLRASMTNQSVFYSMVSTTGVTTRKSTHRKISPERLHSWALSMPIPTPRRLSSVSSMRP
jgi:hypothetical protein